MKNINTLEQLSEYINNNSVWPWDVEEIIERNGWITIAKMNTEYATMQTGIGSLLMILAKPRSSKCNYSDIDITAKSGQ